MAAIINHRQLHVHSELCFVFPFEELLAVLQDHVVGGLGHNRDGVVGDGVLAGHEGVVEGHRQRRLALQCVLVLPEGVGHQGDAQVPQGVVWHALH